jgi:hypothetical protein
MAAGHGDNPLVVNGFLSFTAFVSLCSLDDLHMERRRAAKRRHAVLASWFSNSHYGTIVFKTFCLVAKWLPLMRVHMAVG